MAKHRASQSADDQPFIDAGLKGSSRPIGKVDATDAKLVPILLSIAKSTRALTGIKLAELGFYSGQDELLLALDEREPVPVSKLAEILSVRPSTVSKMMDRLVDRDMIQRNTDVSDRRRTMVHITATGLEARRHLLTLRQKLDADLVASYPGDVDVSIKALETVAAALRKRLLRIR